jgi:hypothetical protein
MNEESEIVTLEANPDFYPLPPVDGKEHTAFPLNTRRMIVDWFIGGRSVDYIARYCSCGRVDIEQVLRVGMVPTP